jgi:hypothetical protein
MQPDWLKMATPDPETEQQFADERVRENAADLAGGLMEICKLEIELFKLKLQRGNNHDDD